MNRTLDIIKTVGGGGLVPFPFKFTVDGSGNVTSQYPSAAVMTVELNTSSSWNVLFGQVVDVVAAVASPVVDADNLDAKVEARQFSTTFGGVNLQARESSTGNAAALPAGAEVCGVVWLRNTTVAV